MAKKYHITQRQHQTGILTHTHQVVNLQSLRAEVLAAGETLASLTLIQQQLLLSQLPVMVPHLLVYRPPAPHTNARHVEIQAEQLETLEY